MDVLCTKLKQISIHHVIFVVLCSVITYLFRASDTHILRPVWRKKIDAQHFSNGKFPTAVDRMPQPLITDLESDGINEIILITQDLQLSILTLPDAKHQDEDDLTLPHVSVKKRATLPIADKRQSRPIAMAAGFTVPYKSMVQVRKQIIVIVTDDWHVFAYSPDLELLWRQRLMEVDKIKDTYSIKAMAVLVTPHSVKKNDEGLIIIGGSFTHKSHQEEEQPSEARDNVTDHSNHTTEEEYFTHFSSFALNSLDGALRWHHLPGDFGETKSETKDTGEEHHWKLGLKKHKLHVGEAPWTYYKHELTKYLPHLWVDLLDTQLTLGRFEKRASVGKDEKEGENDGEEEGEYGSMSSKGLAPLGPEHLIGYAFGGQRPHSPIEHVQNPNAVVIHNHNGIEVLSLLTGNPITRLQLPDDGSLYVDIDSDENVERLTWGQGKGHSPCYIDIWRMFPIQENLERLSTCYSQRMFFQSSWVFDEDLTLKLPPYITKNVARKSGLIRYLMGHHLPTAIDEYDIITSGGLGRVSSLDKNGNFHWQIHTKASWADVSSNVRKGKENHTERAEAFHHSFYPSRQAMALQVHGPKHVLALAGWHAVSLIDMKEGKQLADHVIPCPPIAPLVIGDFDNDGWNDLIISCKLGYLGFTIHRQSNHLYTAMYAVSIFLFILMLAWFLSPDTHNEEDEDLD